ncbi:MAG: cytochrome b/b6 domain-containing protein [Magnetococcus sp. DMHC-1]|nr:cytochrome b/b6 domain-containing protein [Magnetococcales bacterium]
MVPTWDLPTRLCHWLLVILVLDAWISHQFGDLRLRWHIWNGYAILTLLLFRMGWGFVGSSTARFATFLTGWSTVSNYLRSLLRGEAPYFLGHNPAGGWSVAGLLTLLMFQGTFGLFASDDLMASGPLHHLLDEATAGRLTTLHSIGFWMLSGMIILHLGGVFFHLLRKKDNLILPMLTGVKALEKVPPGASAQMQSPWLALPVLVASILFVWLGIQVWKW